MQVLYFGTHCKYCTVQYTKWATEYWRIQARQHWCTSLADRQPSHKYCSGIYHWHLLQYNSKFIASHCKTLQSLNKLLCISRVALWHTLETDIAWTSASAKYKPAIPGGALESLGAISYSSFIVTMALSCIYSKIKRDIGRKSWLFHTPLAFDAPIRGSLSEYCHPVWCGKTRIVGLSNREKNSRTYITV